MSNNLFRPGIHVLKEGGSASATNLFHRVMLMRQYDLDYPKSRIFTPNAALQHPTFSSNDKLDTIDTVGGIFKSVQSNIVQSIRAFKGPELLKEAKRLGHHFLYAKGGEAKTKAEVLAAVTSSMCFPKPYGKNYDALRTTLTEEIDKAGPQPGFVVMLEGLPSTQKFDKDARETLLDVFRDAAEFWAKRRVCFRVFYSFALMSSN